MKFFLKCILVLTVFSSCTKTKKNYLTISGKVENQIYDSIMIYDFKDKSKKIIQLASDGSFKDTLKVTDGFYGLNIGRNYKKIFFQNGDEIVVNVDAKNYQESLSFSGKGSEEINLSEKIFIENSLLFQEEGWLDVSENDFKNRMDRHFGSFDSLLNTKSIDSIYANVKKKEINDKGYYYTFYEENNYIKNELIKGKPSPKFIDLPNYQGGFTSLDDFKGKYVYINFWGTACPPCFKVLPFFKDVVEKYKNRNIEFVSVSFENKRSLGDWHRVLKEYDLTGVQLYTNFMTDEFIKAYRVKAP